MTVRAASAVAVVSFMMLPGPAAPSGAAAGSSKRGAYERGEAIFFHETFGGNGRTCATCHDPRNEFTVSPELAQGRYQLDPGHPLFRPIDSDDGAGNDYTTLLTRAVFHVTIPLHANVTLVDNPARRSITVLRAVPTIANVALTAPYLQDGRAATLQEQALGAIHDHIEPGRKPRTAELDALKAFMTELFYPLRLRSLGDDRDPLPKAPGFSLPVTSSAALRGQISFNQHCRTCHSGELAETPQNPAQPRFANSFVSDVNRPGFPVLRLAFRQKFGPTQIAETPDPGRAAITGDLRDLNAFNTPSLRGVKHTAPYFHDSSAATLGEVIDHYNDHFLFQISPEERDDLIAFLELL